MCARRRLPSPHLTSPHQERCWGPLASALKQHLPRRLKSMLDFDYPPDFMPRAMRDDPSHVLALDIDVGESRRISANLGESRPMALAPASPLPPPPPRSAPAQTWRCASTPRPLLDLRSPQPSRTRPSHAFRTCPNRSRSSTSARSPASATSRRWRRSTTTRPPPPPGLRGASERCPEISRDQPPSRRGSSCLFEGATAAVCPPSARSSSRTSSSRREVAEIPPRLRHAQDSEPRGATPEGRGLRPWYT